MFTSLKVYLKQPLNSQYVINVKKYGRWSHRRPVRVLSSDNDENPPDFSSIKNQELSIEDKVSTIPWRHIPSSRNVFERKSTIKKACVKTDKGRKTSIDMLQTVIDSNGELIYTKLPNKDSRVTSLLTSIQSNSGKDKKSILLEGKRIIKEALLNNCKLEYLLFSRKDDIKELQSFLPKSGAILYKIPYKEIQLWSDLTTSPGVMGIFKKPTLENVMDSTDSIPLTIICDNIREPGNLGSILRTCAGVGCQSVILTKGCVNLWDPKVTRSGCGAHFYLKIHTKMDWSQIKDHVQSNNQIFIADNNTLHSSGSNPEETSLQIQSIPLVPYYGIHINKTESIVLIIGGETEGLSDNAYKFVYNFRGVRLNIPLNPGFDSVNSSVALGIMVFEMRRQMLLNVVTNQSRIHNT